MPADEVADDLRVLRLLQVIEAREADFLDRVVETAGPYNLAGFVDDARPSVGKSSLDGS